jgi:BirA family transcriptional regulator, biotin operon repressor / biotin---[acetyl-CoA-carboxylase] ligase
MNEAYAAAAAGLPEPFRLLIRETVTSTNDELRLLAENGATEGLILVATEQTAGRGRRGAAWFSARGESLAFSILLRPQEPKWLWPRLALVAGVAVATALESRGFQVGIKWPNDVWLGHKKVAGILVESGANFAIVGLGLNVNSSEFPPAVAEIATSLKLEMGIDFSLPEVLAGIVQQFARLQPQIGSDFNSLLDSVRQRCVLTGHRVSLITAAGPLAGIVEGIAAGGELLLRTANGIERLLQADEIRLSDPANT